MPKWTAKTNYMKLFQKYARCAIATIASILRHGRMPTCTCGLEKCLTDRRQSFLSKMVRYIKKMWIYSFDNMKIVVFVLIVCMYAMQITVTFLTVVVAKSWQISAVHTMSELKMTGNALRGSRAVINFDQHFDKLPQLQLLKELFIQAFATPRAHPKSKPFVDRVMSFYWLDNRVWFRNYQVIDWET